MKSILKISTLDHVSVHFLLFQWTFNSLYHLKPNHRTVLLRQFKQANLKLSRGHIFNFLMKSRNLNFKLLTRTKLNLTSSGILSLCEFREAKKWKGLLKQSSELQWRNFAHKINLAHKKSLLKQCLPFKVLCMKEEKRKCNCKNNWRSNLKWTKCWCKIKLLTMKKIKMIPQWIKIPHRTIKQSRTTFFSKFLGKMLGKSMKTCTQPKNSTSWNYMI